MQLVICTVAPVAPHLLQVTVSACGHESAMIFFASCKRSRASQIVNRSSLGAMRQPGGVSSGSRMVESIPADINARWARSASERYRNPCAGAMSLLMPNAPDQAGRGNDVRLSTERWSRPCLKPVVERFLDATRQSHTQAAKTPPQRVAREIQTKKWRETA